MAQNSWPSKGPTKTKYIPIFVSKLVSLWWATANWVLLLSSTGQRELHQQNCGSSWALGAELSTYSTVYVCCKCKKWGNCRMKSSLWFMFANAIIEEAEEKTWPLQTTRCCQKQLMEISYKLPTPIPFRIEAHLYSRSHGFFQRSTKLSTRLSDDLLCISFSFTTESKTMYIIIGTKGPKTQNSWQNSNLFAK